MHSTDSRACSRCFLAKSEAFPRHRIQDVVSTLKQAGSGYVDMLLETYAHARDEVRWAIIPSVLQHVGIKSSKPSGQTLKSGFTIAESIRNYAFEMNNVETLRREHVHQLAMTRG